MHVVLADMFALRHPKMRDAVTLRDLLELEWDCARFHERTLREQLRDVIQNRDVQSCILAWPARAGLVVLPFHLIHLHLTAERAAKSGIAKWSLSGSETALIGCANSATRSQTLGALPVLRFFAVDSEAAATWWSTFSSRARSAAAAFGVRQ